MATIDTHFDGEVFVLTVRGAVSIHELVAAIRSQVGEKAKRCVLWNLLEADSSGIKDGELFKVVDATRGAAASRGDIRIGGKSAVVVRKEPAAERAVELFRTYAMVFVPGVEYRSFYSLESALAWLRSDLE